jgi:hypothetical protein
MLDPEVDPTEFVLLHANGIELDRTATIRHRTFDQFREHAISALIAGWQNGYGVQLHARWQSSTSDRILASAEIDYNGRIDFAIHVS